MKDKMVTTIWGFGFRGFAALSLLVLSNNENEVAGHSFMFDKRMYILSGRQAGEHMRFLNIGFRAETLVKIM